MVAKNVPHTSTATMLAAVSVRRRNIDSGSSGDTARRSQAMNSARSTAPAARNATVVADVQPSSMLLLIAYTIDIRPLVTSTAPSTSAGPRGLGGRRVRAARPSS